MCIRKKNQLTVKPISKNPYFNLFIMQKATQSI